MKTTDLIYQNQKVLKTMQNMVLQSKKHIEVRTNLESVAETLQMLTLMLETQIVFNSHISIKFEKECACKNQAYGFIANENLIGRFNTFCKTYPTNLFIGLTGGDILQDK